jgi:hypothetical protein
MFSKLMLGSSRISTNARAAVYVMQLARRASCPAFRRSTFSHRLSTSGCPSCGTLASAGCAAAPADRALRGSSKRLFNARRRLGNLRPACFESIRSRSKHDPSGRLSCRAGGISGHRPDFLGAVLCRSDYYLACLRGHGSDHCSCPLLEYPTGQCRMSWQVPRHCIRPVRSKIACGPLMLPMR